MNKEYRLSALRVQRNVMEAEMDQDELAESQRYDRIQQRISELRDEVSESTAVS